MQVVLRYKKGEYLFVEVQPVVSLELSSEKSSLILKDQTALKESVTRSEQGHVYVANIPMIDQGKKGYCAAATLARVLQYYGYAVDQHALAELAETEGQASEDARGGTHRKNIIRAMQRVCNGTPFRLKSIRKPHPKCYWKSLSEGCRSFGLFRGMRDYLRESIQIKMKLSFRIRGALLTTIRLAHGIIFVTITLN